MLGSLAGEAETKGDRESCQDMSKIRGRRASTVDRPRSYGRKGLSMKLATTDDLLMASIYFVCGAAITSRLSPKEPGVLWEVPRNLVFKAEAFWLGGDGNGVAASDALPTGAVPVKDFRSAPGPTNATSHELACRWKITLLAKRRRFEIGNVLVVQLRLAEGL